MPVVSLNYAFPASCTNLSQDCSLTWTPKAVLEKKNIMVCAIEDERTGQPTDQNTVVCRYMLEAVSWCLKPVHNRSRSSICSMGWEVGVDGSSSDLLKVRKGKLEAHGRA